MQRFIGYSWAGKKPQDKFLVLLWLAKLGKNYGNAYCCADISRELGLREKLVRECLKRLVDLGYLIERENVCTHIRPGRVANLYALNEERFGNDSHDEECRHSVTYQLLTGIDFSEKSIESLSKYLLLIILIYQADKTGMVKNTSYSDMSRLTGVSNQRIKRYLTQFREKKYVWFFLAGGSDGIVLNKYKSVFNLSHELMLVNSMSLDLQRIKTSLFRPSSLISLIKREAEMLYPDSSFSINGELHERLLFEVYNLVCCVFNYSIATNIVPKSLREINQILINGNIKNNVWELLYRCEVDEFLDMVSILLCVHKEFCKRGVLNGDERIKYMGRAFYFCSMKNMINGQYRIVDRVPSMLSIYDLKSKEHLFKVGDPRANK
ncbi:TPA: hypothetical protein KDY13_002780 [Vibrio parahaemolyticus]|nr:hypothetical protein [Vibrio parahaemolyticus]